MYVGIHALKDSKQKEKEQIYITQQMRSLQAPQLTAEFTVHFC